MNKILSKEISFELAKLLKEKGFDYHSLYNDFSDNYDYFDRTVQGRVHVSDFSEDKFPDSDKWFPVPYISQVIDWLYEKHNLWIEVHGWINQPVGNQIWKNCFQSFINGDATDVSIFKTPLETYEYAIKYCLKNLL